MERRVRALEQRIGRADDACGPLAIIAPNSWSDADRAAWERAEILHDGTTHDDLIEKYSGHRPQPCRGHRPHITVLIIPAPAEVEEASEGERAAWRERVSSRRPWEV
jgi:hypothetical protein